MESFNEHHKCHSGILKKGMEDQQEKQHQEIHHKDHIKFDEQTIAEHDQDRGTRTKIVEPKTPYHEDTMEDSQENQSINDQHSQEDVLMQDIHIVSVLKSEEEEVKRHLEEAERNKQLNAQLQKEKNLAKAFHEELSEKLDQTQQSQEDEAQKHKEFLQKRKQHYKNEFSPAELLKKQVLIEDEDETTEK